MGKFTGAAKMASRAESEARRIRNLKTGKTLSKKEWDAMSDVQKKTLVQNTERRQQLIRHMRTQRGKQAKNEDIVRRYYKPKGKETFKRGHRSARYANTRVSDQMAAAGPAILAREAAKQENITRQINALPYFKRRKAVKARNKARTAEELRHMQQERAYWHSNSDHGIAYKKRLTPAQQRHFANKVSLGIVGTGGAAYLSEALKERRRKK